eukprot:scaffold19773_cov43-Cyclotella_meneghiniana.AAC.10
MQPQPWPHERHNPQQSAGALVLHAIWPVWIEQVVYLSCFDALQLVYQTGLSSAWHEWSGKKKKNMNKEPFIAVFLSFKSEHTTVTADMINIISDDSQLAEMFYNEEAYKRAIGYESTVSEYAFSERFTRNVKGYLISILILIPIQTILTVKMTPKLNMNGHIQERMAFNGETVTWHHEAIGQSMDEDDLPVAERLKIGKEWVKKYHEDVKEKGGSYMTYDTVMAKLSDKK